MDGINGNKTAKEDGAVEPSGSETVKTRLTKGFSELCNQQVGGSNPSTSSIVLADFVSFASARGRKLIHSVARPLQIKPASLGFDLGEKVEIIE